MLTVQHLGCVVHDHAREVQSAFVKRRVASEIDDHLLLCEHPPTITLGRRAHGDMALEDPELWRSRGIQVCRVERGGAATFHGPGQIVFYPVVSLREARIGVRSFVAGSLQSVANALCSLGLDAHAELDRAGVWVERDGQRRKICAIGLKVVHGVTDYGLSVNISNDLFVYRLFSPCGLSGALVTNAEKELEQSFSYAAVLDTVLNSYRDYLNSIQRRERSCGGVSC